MIELSPPVTRLSTALWAFGWMKRVASPLLMEKVFQLMIAALLF